MALAAERNIKVKIPAWALILPCLFAPVLFVNVIALSVLQNGMNRIYAFEDNA